MNCIWNKMTYIVLITFTLFVILITTLIVVVVTTHTTQGSPITRNCTKTTGQGGEQIETCHVVVQNGSTLINKTETTIRGPRSSDNNDPGKVIQVKTLTTPGNSITRNCTKTTAQGGEHKETNHVVGQSGRTLINRPKTTIRDPGSININKPGKVVQVPTQTTQGNPITRNCTKTTGQGGEQIETCHVVVQNGSALINKTETTIRGPRSSDINDPGKVIQVKTLTAPGKSITRNCTKTTALGGKVTETCHVFGQSGRRHINRTETTISGPGFTVLNNESGKVFQFGNSHISHDNN